MEYPDIPIIVIQQSTTSVTFKVQNSFVETLASLYVQFHGGRGGDYECYPDSNVGPGEWSEYTAFCMKNCPITIVDVWAQDDSFEVDGNDAVVPECCHPIDDHSAPTVQYTFKIHCDSQCPDLDCRRKLSEHVETIQMGSAEALAEFKNRDVAAQAAAVAGVVVDIETLLGGIDAHFCSSEDYPCGDVDGLVHVCHYSARDGYQTFCVPEQDSDIMSFYPKDYCGPCVGGYGSKSVA
jgi:hypothetical protein